jgi:hypothetical protein
LTNQFRHESLPKNLKYGNILWRKVYLQFHVEHPPSPGQTCTGHNTSFHLNKGWEYQYDDCKYGGRLTRALIRDYQQNPRVSIERVVYFREPPRIY